MRKTINIKAIVHYFLICVFVAVHGALFYAENQLDYWPQLLVIIISFLGLRGRIPRKFISFVVILLVLIFIARLSAGSGIGPKLFLDLSCAYLIVRGVYFYDSQAFFTRLTKVMMIISILSLIGFALWNIDKSLITNVLPHKSCIYGGYYDGIVFLIKQYEPRNVGPFYEPGVYATILLLMIFYLLYYGDRIAVSINLNQKAVLIFVVTLITTNSTMGYIGLLILFTPFVFKKFSNSEFRRYKKYIVWLAICVASFILYDYIVNAEKSLWSTYVIGKIGDINSTVNTGSYVTSGGARWRTAQISWELFLENPLGVGYDRFENYEKAIFGGIVTGGNILFKHLATSGILLFSFTIYMVFKNVYRYSPDGIVYIIYIALFINITLSQSQMWYPVFLIAGILNPKQFNSNRRYIL